MADSVAHNPVAAEEEDYESDVYEVDEEDDDEFGEEGADEDAEDYDDEEDDEDEDAAPRGQSLTALLVQDPSNGLGANADAEDDEDDDDDEEEDDEGFAPPGEVDPADLPIDGTAHELLDEVSKVSSEAAAATEDALTALMADPDAAHRAKNASTTTTAVSVEINMVEGAVGMKRKTSSDEGEEEDIVEESEAKRVKA